jgi:type II secretory pathway pseudopilin PulG
MKVSARRGVTLIEIMAVILLTSLVIGTMVVVFRSPRQQADDAQLMTRIMQADRLARVSARRHGGAVLEFDADAGEALIRSVSDKPKNTYQRCRFGGRSQLTLEQAAVDRSGAERITEIQYDERGHCQSYRFCMQSPNTEPIWVFVVGATGQKIVSNEKREIDALFTH